MSGAIFAKLQRSSDVVTFELDPHAEDNLNASTPGDHCMQNWWWSGHFPARSSHFSEIARVPYLMTFDLGLDHTPENHCVKVLWGTGHFVGTAATPDRQTDTRCLVIVQLIPCKR